MASTKQVPIPGPKGVPFLGNVYDIESELPINSFEQMADSYGMDLDLHEQGIETANLWANWRVFLPSRTNFSGYNLWQNPSIH